MLRPLALASPALLLLVVAPAGGSAQSAEATLAAIESAQQAAPPDIADGAGVTDLMGHELRKSLNGWVCYPDVPETPRSDPMCVDATWAAWLEALENHAAPHVERLGVAYMLLGGSDASLTDPFATEPADGEDWIDRGPHIMLLVPDPSMLEGMPTDASSGGPYVMWSGTPYAHIMLPAGDPLGDIHRSILNPTYPPNMGM